jgi:hypothetical protein
MLIVLILVVLAVVGVTAMWRSMVRTIVAPPEVRRGPAGARRNPPTSGPPDA